MIEGEEYLGLFGYLGKEAEVKEVCELYGIPSKGRKNALINKLLSEDGDSRKKTVKAKNLLYPDHFNIIESGNLLMLSSKQIIDNFYRIKCLNRNFNKYRYPIRH